jgi:hypothetical protein
MRTKEEPEIKAVIEINQNEEIYKIVDFLNKNLKDKDVIFGLTKKNEKMNITIYKTER